MIKYVEILKTNIETMEQEVVGEVQLVKGKLRYMSLPDKMVDMIKYYLNKNKLEDLYKHISGSMIRATKVKTRK